MNPESFLSNFRGSSQNRTLAEKGREKMSTFYWTSTDDEDGLAWGSDFSDDSWTPGSGYDKKQINHTIRAVCRF